MKGTFLKFKRRLDAIRIARSIILGASVGLVLSGAWMILWKLAVIDFAPIISLYIGLGSFVLTGGLAFLLSHKSNKKLAEELDSQFGLKARAQTMIQYAGEEGDLVEIQRQDAEIALSKIPVRKYKFKGLWIYLIAFVLSAAVLSVGFVLSDVRDYTPPEEVIPFELSAMQETGINNLITYIEASPMEDEFKIPLSEVVKELLITLKQTHTQKDMLIAVDTAMTDIRDITHASSNSTEVLNALWDSGDFYFKHLAKVLDTSDWSEPNEEAWGDFSEKLLNYAAVLMGDDKEDVEVDAKETLYFALDTMSRKLSITLEAAGVGEDDEICLAINRLFNSNPGGFAPLLSRIEKIDEDEAREMLSTCLNLHSTALYDAISLNKVNANVGEHVMRKLAALLIVSIPEFERPDFVKNNESINQGQGNGDDEENNVSGDGGLGEGATYGSNDIVIDPLTGEPIEYGKLLDKYNAIMYEKLDGDSYTEEQKEAIKKYFDLLWSGLEKKEGN